MFSIEKETECIHGVCTPLGCVRSGLCNLNHYVVMVTISCFLERKKQNVYTVSVRHYAVSVVAYTIKIIYCHGYYFMFSR